FHLESACQQGFAAARSVIPVRLFARAAEIWPKTILALEHHKDLPKTLCHGDVHLKNWYILADGRMGLADWGVVHRGHWSRDVAYTITTALPIELRRSWERDLLRLYLDRLAECRGPRVALDD